MNARDLPGSFYRRNGRWYWAVKLPGEPARKVRPLSNGSSLATKSKAEAMEIALELWEKADGKSTGCVDMDAVLAGFRDYNAMGGSETQAAKNSSIVRKFLRIAAITDPADIREAHIVHYLAGLKGSSDWTIHHHRNALSKFCQYARRFHGLQGNPARDIELKSPDEQDPVHLSRQELATALRTAKRIGLWAVWVAAFTGWRKMTVAHVKRSDVEQTPEGLIAKLKLKGRKHKEVKMPLHRMVEIVLKRIPDTGDDYYFPQHASRWWDQYLDPVRAIVPLMARKGGGWHDLRRTFATLLARQKVDIKTVSLLLGHTRTATTERFYTDVKAEHGRSDLERL